MTSNELIQYRVTANGAEIASPVYLPAMSQIERNKIRQKIAVAVGIPRHYIRLRPQRIGGGKWIE